MNETPIITSILDTDLYKLTQQQIVFHQYPKAFVKYEFRCRNKGVKLGFLAESIKSEISQWKSIQLTQEEETHLGRFLYFKNDYIDFLSQYRFNSDLVNVSSVDEDLVISIEGSWIDTILFEVPLLATINELYFKYTTDFNDIREQGIARLDEKCKLIVSDPRLSITEFGTRRRYSKAWQKYVLRELAFRCPQVKATSNVKLAMDLALKPLGTMAHEYISAHIALVDNIRQAQKRALHVWQQEYDDALGIALTDTFTTKAFFMDFDKTLSNTYSGVRHDSGDPIKFGWDVINHYNKMDIDPKTKTIVFSDGLTVPKAIEIFKTFTGLIGLSFGIGTSLTNDFGIDPLNIVIKLVECNGKPVVKLSDVEGKNIGDKLVIEAMKEAYLK